MFVSDHTLLSGNLSELLPGVVHHLEVHLTIKENYCSFCRLSKDRQVLVVITEQPMFNF